MRKSQSLLMCIAGIAVLFLSACGEKKITVKGADGTEYESYQECCAANDFEAAHMYLAKIQNSNEKGQYDYDEAKEFVFQKEALYLMSIGDESAKKRIVYLLKEEGNNDDHVDMLIDLAIDNDDEAFVKTLTKQYKSSISSEMLRKLVEYLYLQKGEHNLEFVQTLLNRYNKSDLLLDAAVEKGDEDLVVNLAKQYNGSLSFPSFKNMMDFLEVRGNSNYQILFNKLSMIVGSREDIIDYAIEKKQTTVVRKLQNAILEESIRELLNSSNFNIITKGLHEDDISVDGPECNERISAYNQRCIKVLQKAIDYKQLDMANKVIRIMKPNIVTHTGNSGNPRVDGVVVGFGKFYAQYVYSEINEAKSILNEAVRSGAFK